MCGISRINENGIKQSVNSQQRKYIDDYFKQVEDSGDVFRVIENMMRIVDPLDLTLVIVCEWVKGFLTIKNK